MKNQKHIAYAGLFMMVLFITSGCPNNGVQTQTSENIARADEMPVEGPGELQPELVASNTEPQPVEGTDDLDRQVSEFLTSQRRRWRDSNVPYSDGQLLHDIIVENNYKYAIEIGTSTGHSGIWIAWALSKTGGRLITIEIDQGRYNQAKSNFEAAGVEDYIDARLADAHDLVPQLEGPVDFVFCDADKEWYINYFKALAPKMVTGGCFTAHNTNQRGVREFISYVRDLPGFETTIDNRGSGMGITYKKAD